MTTIRPCPYDLRSLKLSPEEGFVLSRVDAPVTLKDLAAISGIDEARLATIVETLASQGAIEIEGRPRPPPAAKVEPPPPSAGSVEAPPPSASSAEPPPSSKRSPRAAATPRRSVRIRAIAASSPPASSREPSAPASRPAPAPPKASVAPSPKASAPPARPSVAPPLVALPPPPPRKSVAPPGAAPSAPPPPKKSSAPPVAASPPPPPPPPPEDEAFGSISELDVAPESEPFGELEPVMDGEEPTLSTVSPVALAIGGVCDVGKARSNNEDALAVVDFAGQGAVDVLGKQRSLKIGPRGILLAVSDGMGGENAGEVASALVLETLNGHLAVQDIASDPAGALAAAVAEANTRVMAAAEKRELAGMGATLVAVLVTGSSAITAEVGDSRAYVLRAGALTQLSKDQTHVRLLVEQGLLKPEDVKKSRAKNVVLQACGKQPDVIVAQRQLALRKGDRLLLCSDGLTLHVEDGEIEAILAAVPSPDEASARLVQMTNERGGKDNVTVLVADVEGALPPPRPDETAAASLTLVREFAPGEGAP